MRDRRFPGQNPFDRPSRRCSLFEDFSAPHISKIFSQRKYGRVKKTHPPETIPFGPLTGLDDETVALTAVRKRA